MPLGVREPGKAGRGVLSSRRCAVERPGWRMGPKTALGRATEYRSGQERTSDPPQGPPPASAADGAKHKPSHARATAAPERVLRL